MVSSLSVRSKYSFSKHEISYGSNVHQQIENLATQLANDFPNAIDYARDGQWSVGEVNTDDDNAEAFKHSLHAKYSGLNPDEKTVAEALDDLGHPWVRNPSRSGYGIPLAKPDDNGSEHFYPDFLFWRPDGKVFAIEHKGKYLLDNTVRNKLLNLTDLTIVLFTIDKKNNKVLVTRSNGGAIVAMDYPNLHEAIRGEL